MILFLTLIYLAFLAILVKLKIVRFNLFWKLSPLLWMLMLTVVLFIPMQWGAPSGAVNVYRTVVEIVPNVSGEVIEVNAQGSKPISKGDVLFRLDPQPYQIEVDRLLAAVKEAEQTAKMLPAGLAEADANVAQAEAAIVAAKQQAASLESALVAAKASVAKSQAQLELAQTENERAQKLLASNATSKEDAETKERNVELAKASVKAAEASRQQAQLALESTIDGVNTSVIEAQERLKASQAAKQKAELAVSSTINGENTQVAQLRAQLATAQFNLAQTTVVAPSDGFVIGMTLRARSARGRVPRPHVDGFRRFVQCTNRRWHRSKQVAPCEAGTESRRRVGALPRPNVFCNGGSDCLHHTTGTTSTGGNSSRCTVKQPENNAFRCRAHA